VYLRLELRLRPVRVRRLSDDTERGSAAVVEALVDNHRRFLAFLERRVGSRAVAEDLLQDAFVRGLERAPTLRRSEAATAWFYRVLRNALVDHFRKQRTESRVMAAAAAEPPDLAEEDEELRRTVCGCIAGLVDTLKPEYASALRRVELEGASVRDYAEEAGITPNNAGVRLHRARESLRRQVARSCGTCAEHGCEDCVCGGAGPSGRNPCD
jgi:RNA polymerase sigma factor (sigma-70 family)